MSMDKTTHRVSDQRTYSAPTEMHDAIRELAKRRGETISQTWRWLIKAPLERETKKLNQESRT